MATRSLLALAAAVEVVMGGALMVSPALVTRLLLGEDVSGAGIVVGRVAGFALLSLGVACWPGHDTIQEHNQSARGMLAYNLLITLYLLGLGIRAEPAGVLLWPAILLHAVITMLLIRGWFSSRMDRTDISR